MIRRLTIEERVAQAVLASGINWGDMDDWIPEFRTESEAVEFAYRLGREIRSQIIDRMSS